jgi:hypothetical protein
LESPGYGQLSPRFVENERTAVGRERIAREGIAREEAREETAREGIGRGDPNRVTYRQRIREPSQRKNRRLEKLQVTSSSTQMINFFRN